MFWLVRHDERTDATHASQVRLALGDNVTELFPSTEAAGPSVVWIGPLDPEQVEELLHALPDRATVSQLRAE